MMSSPLSRLASPILAGALLAFAPLAGALPSLAAKGSGAACLAPASWATLDKERPLATAPGALLTDIAQRDVVLLGEQHDEEDHHRWQLQTLAALHALRPDMVIGFEMFPRRLQPILDRWVAGELTVKEFLAQSEWNKVWNMPPDLYLPLFQFARLNRIPMVALNVERTLTQAITEKGWDAVPEREREGVGRPAPPPPAYRAFLEEVHRQHGLMRAHDDAAKSADTRPFEFFIESQTTWDRAMAEALAQRLKAAEGASSPLVVGIMGSGHIRNGHGVPHQLGDLGVSRVGTLLPVPADHDCKDLQAGLADAVFVVPKQALSQPEPPRLGVRLEQDEGSVRVAEVTSGSLAERTGLKSGDRLVEIAGVAADKVTLVVSQVRGQPAGTWLPLRVQRGDDMLELIVKFPVQR